MSSVLEPGSSSRDVIGGALALDLNKDGHISQVFTVPFVERFKKLETVRSWGDVYFYT